MRYTKSSNASGKGFFSKIKGFFSGIWEIIFVKPKNFIVGNIMKVYNKLPKMIRFIISYPIIVTIVYVRSILFVMSAIMKKLMSKKLVETMEGLLYAVGLGAVGYLFVMVPMELIHFAIVYAVYMTIYLYLQYAYSITTIPKSYF